MKRVLMVVALAAVVAACGDDSSGGGGSQSGGAPKTLTIYSSLPLQGAARTQAVAAPS